MMYLNLYKVNLIGLRTKKLFQRTILNKKRLNYIFEIGNIIKTLGEYNINCPSILMFLTELRYCKKHLLQRWRQAKNFG